MAASVDRPGYSERRRNPAPEEALRSADARLGFEPATDPTNSRPECRMAAGSHRAAPLASRGFGEAGRRRQAERRCGVNFC
jgi:hypothetical protein